MGWGSVTASANSSTTALRASPEAVHCGGGLFGDLLRGGVATVDVAGEWEYVDAEPLGPGKRQTHGEGSLSGPRRQRRSTRRCSVFAGSAGIDHSGQIGMVVLSHSELTSVRLRWS